jgi:hypothetical protein
MTTCNCHETETPNRYTFIIFAAHQQEIRAITLDNEREKSDLEEAHCQEIIDLRERLRHSHIHAIDEIEQHYKNEFDELEKHHTVSGSSFLDKFF